ncbi:MAG: GH32 C-terminal domain-containing protein [Armatimonadetes bacterium]|nr:GH32 C-terminal domain-containing protein [Armatimonadota bacterium]
MKEILTLGPNAGPLLVAAAALALLLMCACRAGAADAGSDEKPLVDKTLVVWAAVADLDQQGGSALTIEDGQSHFDGIVFGELAPRRWMPGSDGWRRTQKSQDEWPQETASPDEFVQIALVYRDREVSLFRNGQKIAGYMMAEAPLSIGLAATVVMGRRHLDAGDPARSFQGRIRDARIYDRALDAATLSALRPGVSGSGLAPWAWWSFADEGLREKTGRFTEIRLIGGLRLQDGCLALPGQGGTVIASAGSGEAGSIAIPSWSQAGTVLESVVRNTRFLREQLLADPWRPRYHFCVPEDIGEPGDPNGAFYHEGRYHLMYLYNRSGSGFCWGHISSADLVHWRHHPDSIGPGDGDEGCFSGGGFADEDGTAYLTYWMLWGGKGIGIASSPGPSFDHWKKSPTNPAIRSTEFGITEIRDEQGQPKLLGSADPSNIWKKDGRYFVLTGNLLVLNKIGRAPDAPISEQGDRLYLFESPDLKTWRYRHVFYERRPEWTDRSEDNMCPSFLPLPSRPDGGPPGGKHLLLFISHNMGCQYYVGDYRDDRFLPESHGRMSWVDNTYFAPEALVDGRGRQIMWAWLTDNPGGGKARGWSGVYGLPRTLWVGEGGTLRMRPVPELESLRGRPVSLPAGVLEDGKPQAVYGVPGDACEISLEMAPGSARSIGVNVRVAPDRSEETRLYYDTIAGELVFDSTRSGVAGRQVVERAPLKLRPRETLRLRVFVDRSVVEIYANDRQAICRRVFPGRADSLGLELIAAGGSARLRRGTAWEMAPSNPY